MLGLRSACRASTKMMAQRRTLVYVRNGVLESKGIKHTDEVTYLTGSNGKKYPGDNATLANSRNLLGSENADVPDPLILQALTHKSFAHGKKPFNEKLAILGRQFIRLHITAYNLESRAKSSSTSINGFNFDRMPNEQMSSSAELARVGRQAGIDKDIFWKKAEQDGKSNDTVVAKTIDALVGAVLLHRGEAAATKFVNNQLISLLKN